MSMFLIPEFYDSNKISKING